MVTSFSPNQMMQQPMTPMQQYAPQQSMYQSIPPTTAAVNIQIIEPKVIPAMPQNPIYNYPQASLYAQPQMPTPY
ncbi:MAG: hypothetical protein PHV68_08295, partial [Candidatus Gastranaerophilales bacterium]|nr:hypothetical protein [Candidatus Gastranaerophilales bacterium]